ncbi:MAG: GNAT family N-acetyltransferase [Candidatus Dormibacteraeota bacterium]|nr:GNAT family N-acetyltransferase [Candidatus Dormibacteraeota bacterium]
MIDPGDLELRPVRTSDGPAVAALAGPGEAVPFDEWAESPGGLFWVGEMLARVVGVARVRLIAPGTFHLDGLLVDREQRRVGIGAALLAGTLDMLRAQGARQVRAEALDEPARALAARSGFRTLAQASRWRASRVEGGEPARLATDRDLPALVTAGAGGRLVAPGEARDLDEATLRERVEAGSVRLAPGGRAYAVVVAEEPRLVVAALAGRSALWPQLLEELRFEADLHDLPGVEVWLADSDDGGQVLEGAGYHRDDATRLDALELDL